MGIGAAIAGAGALSAGASIIGAKTSADAAKSAASTQAQAADEAAQATLSMYNQNVARVQPWVTAGQQALTELQGATGTQSDGSGNWQTSPLLAPFQPTLSQLQQTPGYQFTLQQGEEAAQNGFAAQGLASSGAAQKGAINYAEGLAGTTYQQQFQNYLTQNAQEYNMLSGLSSGGQAAAGTQSALGANAQTQANALTTSAAAATAGGTVGSANALTGGLSSLSSSAGNSALLYALTSGGAYSPTSGLPSSSTLNVLQQQANANVASGAAGL